jgi:hypothetical protein
MHLNLDHHHHHHRRHYHQVDAWVAEMRDKELMKRDGGTLSPDEERELLRLGEEARAIVSRATDIVMNCTRIPPHLLQACLVGRPTNQPTDDHPHMPPGLHHYNGDTYCWRKETVSFVIGGNGWPVYQLYETN